MKKAKAIDPSGKIVLAGNPNVGKSTLFNLITKSKVHTGNWSGKTVSALEGCGVHNNKTYIFTDLPGISSFSNPSAEEKAAFNEIIREDYDCLVIVADATNLTKSLILTLRILEVTSKCVLCLNLWDVAKSRGITIDINALSFILGIPVTVTSAEKKEGLNSLLSACEQICEGNISPAPFTPLYSQKAEDYLASFSCERKDAIRKLYHQADTASNAIKSNMALTVSLLAAKITNVTVKSSSKKSTLAIDKIVCSPLFGIPLMLLLLGVVLYMTIVLSNYPSDFLSLLFKKGEGVLLSFFSALPLPRFISDLIVYGIYSTTATVVSVMLPPMAIFFPFFTFLENLGYLPRVAFNLDSAFKKCGSCGKQALGVCMGLGCNCVGITSSAIIPSRREKLIAVLTNAFTPCNGRFGALIAVISMFFSFGKTSIAALNMVFVLAFSFGATFLASLLLSKTLLRGENSSFVLELPSYRKPNLSKVIIESIFERTIAITARAIAVAAPIGGLIYILNHFNLLLPLASFISPLGNLMGLDGIILLSFILAIPANEIVFPIMLMLYTNSSLMVEHSSVAALHSILIQNGWSLSTAVCFILFTLMHWPCACALLTVKHETKSIKWTVAAFLLPTLFGIFFCIASNLLLNV